MNRKDFLKQLGFSGAAIFATYCVGGGLAACSSSGLSPATNVDFTLDLTAAENAALKNKGGYITRNTVVVAYTTLGTYVAVTQVCSHEGRQEVMYRSAQNNFYCTAHGATFDLSGNGLNSEGRGGLKVYNTQLTNNSLRVFS